MQKERTTQELIETLGEDFHRCHHELLHAIDTGSVDENGDVTVDPFYARQLVRAFFAYVEGVTFSVKVSSAAHCLDNGIPVTPQERFFAAEVAHALDEKGQILEQRAQLKLPRNVRFAFALAEKADGRHRRFDPSVEWWSCFQKSIKVRDRLTHPKLPGDLDISGDEIVTLLKAKTGFEKVVLSYKLRARTRPGQTRHTTRRAGRRREGER